MRTSGRGGYLVNCRVSHQRSLMFKKKVIKVYINTIPAAQTLCLLSLHFDHFFPSSYVPATPAFEHFPEQAKLFPAKDLCTCSSLCLFHTLYLDLNISSKKSFHIMCTFVPFYHLYHNALSYFLHTT